MRAALGLRAHSGWAAVVAVAGRPDAPVVLEGRRIVIADPAIHGSKQPFHAAEGWPLPKAEEYLKRCTQSTNSLARQAMSAVVAHLQKQGHEVVGCGLLAASGRPVPDSLADTLASHAMIHTAEGDFFRTALAEAAEDCKIRVTRVKEKELLARGAEGLGKPASELQRRLAELGKPLGSPWTQDEKYATLVGWLVLAGRPAAGPRRQAR
jgi:hypothetical protein